MDSGNSEDLRVLDRAEAELEDVERALTRLDDRSYARCEVCDGPIGDARLAASAVARRCADHGPPGEAPVSAGT